MIGASQTTNKSANQAPIATGIPIQTSVNGKPVTLAFGRPRLGVNLIEYGAFTAVQVNDPSSGGGGGGKGGDSGSCFAGETIISTPIGPRRIDSLKVGDFVWSFDPKTGSQIARQITEVHVHDMATSADRMLRVYVVRSLLGQLLSIMPRRWRAGFGAFLADFSPDCLHLTTNHYLWIDGATKIEAQALEVGQPLIDEEGLPAFVADVVAVPQIDRTFNMTVPPYHNYFADGILSHNGSGGGSNKGSTTTNYYADLALGVCEGPISGYGSLWKSDAFTSVAADGWTGFLGEYPQTPWKTEAYTGLAYIGQLQAYLGTSANLSNYNVEPFAFFYGSTPSTYGGGGDADPSLIVPALLSNPKWGAGFPAERIGTLVTNGETHSIPASGAHQITVSNAASYEFNLCVAASWAANGVCLVCVGSSPAEGQYSYDPATGIYSFNAADAGQSVTIRYASIEGLVAYQEFTMASGLWVSPFYDSQAAASSMLDDLVKATYGEVVWTSGVLTIVPRGTVNVTGNGFTFTAPVAPLFNLGDGDFLPNTNATGTSTGSSNDDPIIVSRSRPSDQVNDIKLEFLDRANQYAPAIAEVKDQANIDTFGLRAPASQTVHMFCDAAAAATSAQLQMQDQAIRNTHSITLDERYCVLDPMDIVSETDAVLGILGQWTRILEITENGDGTLSFTAEEYPNGIGAAASYSLNTGGGYIPNTNVDPGPVNRPFLFGMPIPAANIQGLSLGVGLSGGPNWGGCEIHVSSDGGSSYRRLPPNWTIKSRMGFSTADFPVGADPDKTHTLSVDLSESDGSMLSGTQADADQMNTACLIRGPNGDEYVAYQTATMTGDNAYTLGTYIRRGLYGTPIVDHPSGSDFIRLDTGVAQISYQADQIGTPMFLKFPSFNTYGGGLESLDSVEAYEIILPEPPKPPNVTGFGGQQNGNVVKFGWNAVNYPTVALGGYYLARAPQGTTDWALFEILSEIEQGTEVTTAAQPGVWTYGIRAANIANIPGTEIGLSPQAALIDLTIVNVNEVIYGQDEAPLWAGTLSNLVRHYTGVLTPKGSKTVDQYNAIASPSAPTLSAVSGGTMVLRTLYAKVTFVSNSGETLPSSESSLAIILNNLLQIANPGAGSPPAGATGWNAYVSNTSGNETLQNMSPIPFGTNWTEPTSGLVAGALPPTVNSTGWDVFNIFVPDVVATCNYRTNAIDTGYDASLRVFFSENAGFGFDQNGTPDISFGLDTWLTGQTDPNVFIPWDIGDVTLRYLRGELIYNPVEGSVCYINDFIPTVDTAPQTEQSAGSVVIAAGGTAITFPIPFHNAPLVVPIANSTGVTGASAVNPTATGFGFHIWTGAVDSGGTGSWTATGE